MTTVNLDARQLELRIIRVSHTYNTQGNFCRCQGSNSHGTTFLRLTTGHWPRLARGRSKPSNRDAVGPLTGMPCAPTGQPAATGRPTGHGADRQGAQLRERDKANQSETDMIDQTKATEKASEFQPLIDQHKETVFRMLDVESKRMKGLRRSLFGIFRACHSLDAAVAVLHAEEQAWKAARTVDIDGAKRIPEIPGSYRTTKSAIRKAIEDSPSNVVSMREYAKDFALDSGDTLPDTLKRMFGPQGEEGFLRFTHDRYAGENGDTLFFADNDTAKRYAQAAKSRKAKAEKAAKATASGTLATGDTGEPDVLTEKVAAAIGRYRQVMAEALAAGITEADVVAWIDESGTGMRQWIAEVKAKAAPDSLETAARQIA